MHIKQYIQQLLKKDYKYVFQTHYRQTKWKCKGYLNNPQRGKKQNETTKKGRTTRKQYMYSADKSPNISIIKLSVNRANIQIKNKDWQSGFKNMTQYILSIRNLVQV